MSRAFNNNDNSFNTTGFFNNNQNCFNNNDNCYNTTNINNTTNVNSTTLDDRSEVLAWLSPLEPRVRHRDIGARRIDTIGAWLLETGEFKRWHKGSWEDPSYRQTLFCHGAAGVGKSYIISLIIDRLCDEAAEGDATVVCVYFDFAARNEQSPANILGSLLRQLVSGEGEIPEAIAQDFRNDKRAIGGRGLQVSGVLKMFQAIAATRRTFICVDALDECVPEYRTVVLKVLRQIVHGSPNTSLFMTGRPNVRSEVERELGGAAAFLLIRATEDGVVRFLHEKLRRDPIRNIMSNPLEGDIMRSIPAISSETFLPASLYIDAILRRTTLAGREETLKLIKDGSGFGDAYDTTLVRIMAQDEEKATLAIAALTWICHSERPLHVDELCHALAVEIGATDFDPENIPSIGALLDYCQGLIVVDSETSTVRLIHYTVQEYLCSYPGLFSKSHSMLAETCLTYLNSQQVNTLTALPDDGSMPFLYYSARYWGTHANKDFSDHAMALALELLNQYEQHISALSLLEQELPPEYRRFITSAPMFSGLHCASFFGIVELVTVLIYDEGYEVNQQDCAGDTPLVCAAVNGHEVVVKTLLEQGNVDPNRPNKGGQTPLLCAAGNGHERVVQLLLEREDIDPNLSDEDDNGPLEYAAANGQEGVVKLLLERENVDPNRRNQEGHTPLLYSAVNGHEGVFKLLLEREDVDPNLSEVNGIGPLACAAAIGHEGVVKLLLQREDVDPDRRGRNGQTPLVCAAREGHEGVVKLLLEWGGVDPNLPDTDGLGPLGWAASEGRERVVKLLLKWRDVDPDCRNQHGTTPLMCAAGKGHEGVVKLLLQQEDIDPNLSDEDGNGPLEYAAANGHEGVVKLLLERENVDPNRRNKQSESPLVRAAFHGYERVVKLLLEREDIDPNLSDEDGNGPLEYAAISGHEGVVKLLLEREDIDPNRSDEDGNGPLEYAAINGQEGVVKLLLERENVDPNCRNKDGRTPLICATIMGHEGVVELLLRRGDVDLDCLDKHGGTPLSYATWKGHERIVQLLQARKSVETSGVGARRERNRDLLLRLVLSALEE